MTGIAHILRRVGDRLTIADPPLAGYLLRPREIDVDWSVYPASRDWVDRIRSGPRGVHRYDPVPGHPLPATA